MNSVLPLRLQQFLSYKKRPSIEEFLKVQLNPNELDWYNTFLKHRQNDNPEEFVIDYERLIKNLGYSRKDGAHRTLKQLDKDVDYAIYQQKLEKSVKGRPTDNIFLTINAAQRFCLLSKTSEGKVISKTIIHLVECLADYHILSAYLKTKQFRHDTLVELYSNYPVVYLADIFLYENNILKIFKKIGWSNNISSRQDTLQNDMKTNCMFTHVFPCIRSLALEQDILKDPNVTQRFVKEPINGHKSTETITLDEDFTEENLIELIKSKVSQYNVCKEEHELEKNKLLLEKANTEMIAKKLILVENYLQSGMTRERAENVIDHQLQNMFPLGSVPISIMEMNARKNARQYRIQRIDPAQPDTPIGLYESAIHVTREVQGASKARVINAIKEHTLYMGSRWWTVAHDKDPLVVHNLPELKVIRKSPHGLVAKLTKDCTVIKDVFGNQRDAMNEAQLTSPGSISMAIKNGTLSHGHRYMMWNDCTPEQRQQWIDAHGNPDTTEPIGIRVERLHPLTRQHMETYNNIESIVKHFQIGRGTLKTAIKDNRLLKGWYWRYATTT